MLIIGLFRYLCAILILGLVGHHGTHWISANARMSALIASSEAEAEFKLGEIKKGQIESISIRDHLLDVKYVTRKSDYRWTEPSYEEFMETKVSFFLPFSWFVFFSIFLPLVYFVLVFAGFFMLLYLPTLLPSFSSHLGFLFLVLPTSAVLLWLTLGLAPEAYANFELEIPKESSLTKYSLERVGFYEYIAGYVQLALRSLGWVIVPIVSFIGTGTRDSGWSD